MSRILLVDDEEHLAEGITFNLRNWGYDVDVAVTGEEALEAVAQSEYDLLLLDIMLPGIDGLEVARRLRESGNTKPILMLTARNRSGDAIAGLDAGADDYICKPFDLDEVLARIRGALRREVWGRAARGSLEVEALHYGLWRVDFQSYLAVHTDGRQIELTAKELAILRLFAARPGEVISRETFLEEVWGLPGSIETRTVDNFMRKLRLALEATPSKPEHIQSVRGAGYRFVP
ncbi:MAG: response regulator transcription factor [Planctomycetota bacterium]|jgi:DNA-binding response OmpR family regulator